MNFVFTIRSDEEVSEKLNLSCSSLENFFCKNLFNHSYGQSIQQIVFHTIMVDKDGLMLSNSLDRSKIYQFYSYKNWITNDKISSLKFNIFVEQSLILDLTHLQLSVWILNQIRTLISESQTKLSKKIDSASLSKDLELVYRIIEPTGR